MPARTWANGIFYLLPTGCRWKALPRVSAPAPRPICAFRSGPLPGCSFGYGRRGWSRPCTSLASPPTSDPKQKRPKPGSPAGGTDSTGLQVQRSRTCPSLAEVKRPRPAPASKPGVGLWNGLTVGWSSAHFGPLGQVSGLHPLSFACALIALRTARSGVCLYDQSNRAVSSTALLHL